MARESYLASLQADTNLLLDTAGAALDRDVPTCPGWTCERLVRHIGRAFRWTAGWVTAGSAPDVERPPDGEAVVAWARDGYDELLAALRAQPDDDTTVETWTGPRPAIFWFRRMAIEAALHRYDAQTAVGAPTPIDAELAVDAIDEMFTVVLPMRGTGDLGDEGETIHLHATDPDLDRFGGGEWLITLGPGGPTVERVHAKGDVAVRGTVSDLLLLLWNRVDADRFQVFGNAELLTRWREAVTV